MRADQPVRRDQARRRVAGAGGGPGARHRHRLSALLQRGGRGRGRSWPTPGCSTSSRCSSTGSPAARRRGSSATTTRRPDGTCVRDYIHVADLADAHLAAARRLAGRTAPGDLTVNIGRGEGVSVRELADLVAEVTGAAAPPRSSSRAGPGTRPRAVGSVDRIAKELGWSARHGVREMVESAWEGWLPPPPRGRPAELRHHPRRL